MQLDLACRAAAEVHGGAGPAQHLLDSRVQAHLAGPQPRPLLVLPNQRVHRIDHRQPTRLVAADDQAVAVENDVVVGQQFTVDATGGQHTDHILAWTAPALLAQLAEVQQDLVAGQHGVEGRACTVFRAQRRLRLTEQELAVRLRHTEQVTDGRHRNGAGDLSGEVALAAHNGVGHQTPGIGADPHGDPAQRARRERLEEHGAQRLVPGPIGDSQHLPSGRVASDQQGYQNVAPLGNEPVVVAVHRLDVLMPAEHPEARAVAGRRLPVYWFLRAQTPPERVKVLFGERPRVGQIRMIHCHVAPLRARGRGLKTVRSHRPP